MNRIYKVIWSKVRNAYVVVSELAKNHGKEKCEVSTSHGSRLGAALLLSLVLGGGLMAGGVPAEAAAVNAGSTGSTSTSQKNNNTLAVGDNTIANGAGALAVGGGTEAYGLRAIAIAGGRSYSDYTISIGENSVAGGSYNYTQYSNALSGIATKAIAIGNSTSALGVNDVVIGANQTANTPNSAYYETANGNNQHIAVGGRVLVGHDNTATGRAANSVIVGSNNSSNSVHGIAIGQNAQVGEAAGTVGTTSKGVSSTLEYENTMAIGTNTRAYASNSIAIGNNAVAGNNRTENIDYDWNGQGAIALGENAQATAYYTVAVGAQSKANGGFAVALGREAEATSANTLATGYNAKATATGTVANGAGAQASATNAVAMGLTAKASATGAMAMGANSSASSANDVAIGTNSTATRAAASNSSGWTGQDSTWSSWTSTKDSSISTSSSTWNSTSGVVSIGTDGADGTTYTRQLTGVAAGTKDTDAVNMAQWKNTVLATVGDDKAASMTTTYGTDGAARNVTKVLNESLTITGAGDTARSDAADASTKTLKKEALTSQANIGTVVSDNQIVIRLAKDLQGLDSVTTGNTVVNNSGVTITPTSGSTVSLTQNGLNNGGNQITNVASGGDTGTNGANIDDVTRISQKNIKVQGGSNITVTDSTTNGVRTSSVALNNNVDLSADGSLAFGSTTDNTYVDKSGVITHVTNTDGTKVDATLSGSGLHVIGKAADGTTNSQVVADETGMVVGYETGDKANTLFDQETGTGKQKTSMSTKGVKVEGTTNLDTNGQTSTITRKINTTLSEEGVNINRSQTLLQERGLTVGKDAEKTTAGQATVYRTGLNVTGSAVNDTAGKTATVTANGLTANGDTTGDKIATVTSEGMTVQADAARKKTATYDVSGVALQDTDSSKTNTVSVDGMNIQNGTSGAALTTTNLQLGMTNGTGGINLGNQAGGGANAAEGNYLTGLDNKTWDAKNIASGRAATEDQLKAVAESIGTDVSGKTFGLADDANAAVSKTLGNTIQVKGDSKAISTSVDGDALKISLNDNITIGGKDGANGKDGHIGVDGKDGKDGADGYNGKDAVSIDGKDGNEGHIGLNGKDGKDGERGADGKNAYSDISTHFGPASLNDAANVTMADGTTKMTRLRYEDQNGYTHEVATMDDGQVYGGDTGTAFKRYLNQQANVKGGVSEESKLTTTDNIGVVSDGTDTLKVRLAKDLTGLDSVTTGNTVVNNSGISITNGTKSVSLSGNGLNNGGNKITNVANGENDTDAVNYSQLKQVDQKAGKHTVVTVEGDTVAGTTDYAGSSLKLKATTTDGQTTYDLKLGDNLSIGGKDGADGKDGHIGVNGKDGVSGVGIDGKDGISIKGKDGKDGVTIKGIDGVDGVDGAEGHIGLNGKDGMTDIWTKPGAPGLNGKDGETMTRIVYKDPQGQEHQAATLDDGLKFGGDFGDASAVKLNKQVNVKGNARNEADLTDGNIGVVSSQDGANGQLLIKLNKDLDLTEQGSVKLGSVSLSGKGLNNGGQQITNVASGTSGKTWDATTQGYDATWNNAANIGDVKTAINDIKGRDNGGFGLTADDGQSVKQDLGKTITVTGDKNIETKVSDGKLQIGLKKDVDLGPDGSIKTGETTISKDGVETNQITIKDSSISISKDGIDAGNTVIKDVHSGIVNGDDTDNSNAANIGDVKKIAGDAAEGARAKSGKNITVKDDNTVNLNDKITLGDDKNKAQQVAIDGNGATVTAGDGENQVKLDGSKGQITAGGATLGKQENTSGDKNPASGSYLNGLDNKTWDGEHIQSGRAVTEDQLQVVDKKISGGRVFQGDDGKDNAVTVGLGDTMKLTGGADSANLVSGNIGVVKNSDGDGLEIKLAKDIKGLDSVTTGNTTINNSGVTIKSSDSTKGGDIKIATGDVSMGGSQIHDVAPGSNGTDAVNVDQLSSAMNNVEQNFTKLDARVNRAGANAAALAALHPLDFDPDDKLDVAAGTGHYNGANAVAIGAFYRPNEDTMISLGGSMGGGENMINAGVTFKLGQHNHVSTTRVAMAKEIKALKALVNQQYGEMQQMKQMVNQLAGKTALSVDTSALFPDIPQNHWAYEYVTKLAHTGILQGYPDGEFKGDRMMTRYEFATMLYRAIMGGAASNPDLNKDGTLDKLTKEFEPELKYIRIDVIQKDKDGVPTIERVRTTEAARYHKAGK
ncbi:MAG: ESPR-type extended signal peptide-containing protein [Acidaminococcus sp.]|uniref:ESPR-type extended signal peptide-containing protein n=1 Tax=Acidaminococcus sp. TaxID=1872103 RepID=UPI003F150CE4